MSTRSRRSASVWCINGGNAQVRGSRELRQFSVSSGSGNEWVARRERESMWRADVGHVDEGVQVEEGLTERVGQTLIIPTPLPPQLISPLPVALLPPRQCAQA